MNYGLSETKPKIPFKELVNVSETTPGYYFIEKLVNSNETITQNTIAQKSFKNP